MTTAAPTDRTRALRDWGGVCIEEAAHAIGAVLAGARIVECFAKPTHGIVTIDDEHPRAAEIAYWGVYGRCRFEYGRTPPLSRLRTAFREATDADRAHFGPCPELPRRVEGDIEYAVPRIRELAGHLFRHTRASHEDVERVLGITEQRPLPLVVSMFRSRCLW